MRVVLNTDALQARLTGIGRYALELAEGLQQHADIEKLYLFAHGKFANSTADYFESGGVSGASSLLSPKRIAWLRKLPGISLYRKCRYEFGSWKLNKTIKQMDVDVYHSPNYFIHRADIPSVATIHDFSFIHYPDFHPKDRLQYFTRNLPKTIERANHFITDSEFVRQELMQLFGVKPDRVTAIPLGVNAMFQPADASAVNATLQKYQLEYGKYCLAVSTVEPRKNFQNLLLAFAALPTSLQKQYPLVLVGSPGWLSGDLHHKIESLQQRGLLKYLGYIANDDLCRVYAGARGFAYPSFYEGFGLPILEAMASGVPVLTSAISSMPEVASDAAVLVNPYDVDDIKNGLEKLLLDDAFYVDANHKGLTVASRFTWQACVEKTIAIYKKVAK